MLRATWTHGRRGAVIGASAAVVCLGGVLAACGGGGGGGGYVAVGAAGGPSPGASGTAVTPTGGVTLVPLDPSPGDEGVGDSPAGSGGSSTGPGAATPPARETAGGPGPSVPSADGAKSGRTDGNSPSAAPTTSATAQPTVAPGGPAVLSWGDPEREPADERWCEKVTVEFRNSGGTAVRSGTVTFGTHIIGALGIDWATIESTEELPAPIGPGARKKKTWTVCVDDWRVPIGMHIETRDVTVRWT